MRTSPTMELYDPPYTLPEPVQPSTVTFAVPATAAAARAASLSSLVLGRSILPPP